MPFRLLIAALLMPALASAEADPKTLMKAALDQWRSAGSYAEVTMTVHRPDWQRSSSMKSWSQGEDKSLTRFIAPQKDAGVANLMLGNAIWAYTPRLNQVIKLPPSMMNQSVLGSDLSYDDLTRSDTTVDDYEHHLVATDTDAGKRIYIIDSIPKEDTPSVWGRQRVHLRDDLLILETTYIDQDQRAVKRMSVIESQLINGKPVPTVMEMRDLEQPDHWTRLEYSLIRLDIAVPDYLFTQSSLRNPRDWSPR